MGEYEFSITMKGTNKGKAYLNTHIQKIIAGEKDIEESEDIEGKALTDACAGVFFAKDADWDDIEGSLKVLLTDVRHRRQLDEKRKIINVGKNKKQKNGKAK